MHWLGFLVVILYASTLVVSEPDLVDLNRHLQPDRIEEDEFGRIDQSRSNSSCYRKCRAWEAPRICYYRFRLEEYVTLGVQCGNCPMNITDCQNPQCIPADGYERSLLSVNRLLPGPTIQVCKGDRIVVDVKNAMPARSTAIHWHGVYQSYTPWMDGVPMVTQCPINEGHTFRYDYYASNSGTHFWHSHDGLQKMDGLVGSLVVRQPRSVDPNSYLYDYDLASHVILVTDWFHSSADAHFPGTRFHDIGQDADSILINGQGRESNSTETPLAVFRVRQRKRYRFRLIGGTCSVCPVQVTIDGHNMTLIATDGDSVNPITLGAVVLYAGDRFDVVLNANERMSSYWIHVKGLGPCALRRIYQLGILQYIGDNSTTPPIRDPGYEGCPLTAPVLNPAEGPCYSENPDVYCSTDLQGKRVPECDLLKEFADVNLEIHYGFHNFTVEELFQKGTYNSYIQSAEKELGPLLAGTISNISNTFGASPLLSQLDDISPNLICPTHTDVNGTRRPMCPSGFCKCLSVYKVPQNVVVQIVMVDNSTIHPRLNHPFHLHGYAFNNVAQGVFSQNYTLEDLRREVRNGNVPMTWTEEQCIASRLGDSRSQKSSPRPVRKDTMAIPARGYAVFRFKSTNPGYWFFHCHFLYHLATGMSTVIQVGDREDMLSFPEDFPTCNNYVPPIYEDPSD